MLRNRRIKSSASTVERNSNVERTVYGKEAEILEPPDIGFCNNRVETNIKWALMIC